MVWRSRGSWNEPPTVRGQRLVASVPGVADWFSIAEPPTNSPIDYRRGSMAQTGTVRGTSEGYGPCAVSGSPCHLANHLHIRIIGL